MELKRALLEGRKMIGVWGVGHVGYSCMSHFAEEGIQCIGYDVDLDKVQAINRGEMPVLNMDYWLGFAPASLYRTGIARATNSWQELIQPQVAVHFICIPTERMGEPFRGALMDVCRKLATYRENPPPEPPLIIIESTLIPGTIDREVIPFLEGEGLQIGRDFLLGCAPRRDWFSSPEASLKTLNRVYGGTDDLSTKALKEVLSIVCQNLVEAPNHYYAEAVKSVENAYRQLSVVLAFELSNAYPKVDVRKLLELVGTKWNMETYFPSLGVGGYCLPIASHYVIQGAERPEELKLFEQTIQRGEEQPVRVVRSLVQRGAKHVGILGLSYAPNIKVHALSPAIKIAACLTEEGVEVKIHDPLYPPEEIRRLAEVEPFEFPEGLKMFDTVVVVSGHREYRILDHATLLECLSSCRLIVDNTALWKDVDFQSRGIEYHLAGDANWLGGG